MFENKYFTVAGVISLVLLLAVVLFQYSELDRYGIIETWTK
ncbi:MAG: hypothetical protein PHI85_10295 [Victivallaceae bacterium]|nr:hypothetical protein [Victivallaceae bacterium]